MKHTLHISPPLIWRAGFEVFGPPPGETLSTNYLRLFTLTVNARCNVTVKPVNVWEVCVPTAGVGMVTTYCTLV